MDDNLAQLFTYAETMARSQWAEAKIEPWENSSLGSSLTRHIHGHAESEKDTSSHRSRQVKSKQLAGKHDVFTHSESSPNHQFSAVVPPPGQSGFDVHFERMGSAPLKNDTWDDNFAQLFAYSLTKTPSAAPPAIAGSHATAYTLEESTDEEEERHPASCPVAVKYQAPARNVDAYNLAESTDEEEERLPASCPVAVKYKSPASNADAHNLAESTDEEEERLPAHLPVAVKYQARGSNADAHNLAESTDEEEERHPASCPVAVKGQARVSPDGSRRSSAATNETATSFQPSSASTEDGKAEAKAKKGEKGKDEQQRKRTDKNRPKYAGGCAEGWSTEEVRQFWFNQKNRTGEEASKAALDKGMSLEASSDPNDPIYYWQLYSVLGPDRIQKLIHAFYSNVYADDDDPRLRNVFMRMPGRSGMSHHVRQQTAFWVDAFGGGRTYAGGWERVEFHHRYGASEIMNVDGASRWAFHMNRALMTEDLTEDPRVKASLCDFLKTHMDKYGEKFNFDTSQIKFGDTGMRGAMRLFSRSMTQASNNLLGSFSLFGSKSKDKTKDKKPPKAQPKLIGGKWALVRGAVKAKAAK